MSLRPAARAGALVLLAVALTACGVPATPSPGHAAHDPQADRVIAEVTAELGMAFEPAGPHHVRGVAEDGTELDLVGVPVEQVVLSVPAHDPEAGLPYLPHMRGLLHGPDRVYDWVAAMLACRADEDRSCDDHFAQGNLTAQFSDGGPEYEVVTITRE